MIWNPHPAQKKFLEQKGKRLVWMGFYGGLVEMNKERFESHIVRMPVDKSFGFIKGMGKDEDYFFHKEDYAGHFNDLRGEFISAKPGTIKVSFLINETPKGLRAADVKRVTD